MPNISVIVPVYNIQMYVSMCLDSILDQVYQDFELIIIDDGSSDQSGPICEQYAQRDSRIRLVHQKNGGLSAARNVGIELATGEYLTFIDGDDIVHPDYLEHLYRGIIQHNADICMCWFRKFDIEPVSDKYTYSVKRVLTGRDACGYIGCAQDRVSTTACMKLYKTSLWKDIRYPVGRVHEDEAITHKLLYAAKRITELDEELYFYRTTPNSIMNSPFSVKRYDAITAYYERYQFYLDNNEPELAEDIKKIADSQMAKYSIICRSMNIYAEVPKEYKISVLRALRIIRKLDTDEKFHYWLNKVHPNWARAYTYWKKIKAIFKQ